MRSLFGRNGGGSGRLFAGDGAGALCGAFSSGMRLTSHGRNYTGDNQGGSDRQTTYGGSDAPPFLLHEGRGLLHHLDLGIQQLQARLRFGRGEVGLPESLYLQHGIATGEERPCSEDSGYYSNSESNLEDHPVRDGHLRRGAEPHQHTGKSQDNASLAVETLGVRIHRLALCDNLSEQDAQRRELLILVHPGEGTRRLCQRGEPGSYPAARL